jgi:hypothetical protein
MKFNCLVTGLFVVLLANAVFAQGCPPRGDKDAALQFLQANKSHGPDIDPVCVDQAFGTLNYDKSFIKPLIQLLDFERSIEHHISTIMPGTQYPANDLLGQDYGESPGTRSY